MLHRARDQPHQRREETGFGTRQDDHAHHATTSPPGQAQEGTGQPPGGDPSSGTSHHSSRKGDRTQTQEKRDN